MVNSMRPISCSGVWGLCRSNRQPAGAIRRRPRHESAVPHRSQWVSNRLPGRLRPGCRTARWMQPSEPIRGLRPTLPRDKTMAHTFHGCQLQSFVMAVRPVANCVTVGRRLQWWVSPVFRGRNPLTAAGGPVSRLRFVRLRHPSQPHGTVCVRTAHQDMEPLARTRTEWLATLGYDILA
jgi:hypothetical protein